MRRIELIWSNKAQMYHGQHIREHRHACFQLYYILQGAPEFLIAGTRIAPQEGDYFVVPELAPHSIRPIADNRLVCYEFKFLIRNEELAARFAEPQPILHDTGVIRTLLTYIVQNWSASDEDVLEDFEAILLSVLTSFYADAVSYSKKQSRFILTTQYSSATKDMIAYLERNYSHRFCLDALARELNYSKNYLCSLFKLETGYGIVDYLNMLRIRQAVITFVYYDQDIASAGECVGYQDINYFSRVFKKMTGIPPRIFKKALADERLRDEQRQQYLGPITNYTKIAMCDAFAALKKLQEMVLS